MGTHSIKDLERLSGIKAHTIRIWEKRYGLIEPTRTSTNIRSYCDNELKKLLNIAVLNRNGLKISKISELSSQEISSLVLKLTDSHSKPDNQQENLYIAMIDFDEIAFEKILSRAIIQMGFEGMVTSLLFPFLKRIGVMWQTGTVTPVQEHFISNLVRQKIIVAIDSIVVNEDISSKTFLLFLSENEFNEINLLFMNYVLRSRGHIVIYLGTALSSSSLISVVNVKHIDYLLTSIQGLASSTELNKYINELSEAFSNKTIFITGYKAQSFQKTPVNVNLNSDISDFIKTIDNLSLK